MKQYMIFLESGDLSEFKITVNNEFHKEIIIEFSSSLEWRSKFFALCRNKKIGSNQKGITFACKKIAVQSNVG